jgi:hypothetical protein
MSDHRIAFFLTAGFFAFIVVAVLLLEFLAQKSQIANDSIPTVEEHMLRQRTTAYKAAVLLTISISISSILG